MVGNLSIEEAIEALKDGDVATRKMAIESLEKVNDESIIDPLIVATTDENAQVRFKAAEILGNLGDVAVDKLIEEFTKAEGKDKRFLAFALKETEDEKVIPYFVEAIDDDDFGVRKVAVRALGKDFKKSCNKAIKKAEKRQKAKASGKAIVKVIPMSTIKEMEEANLKKAIKEYERYVESKQPKDAAYKRLCVLYRKENDYDNEVRVLETAIEVFADNEKKLAYFEKRLAKLK